VNPACRRTRSALVPIRARSRSSIFRENCMGEQRTIAPVNIAPFTKRQLIELVLPLLHFERIPALLYLEEDGNEVEELAPSSGLMISTITLPATTSAGDRVANDHEIWLHSDGTFHKYLWTAAWETLEFGCTQRHYLEAVGDEEVSLEDLIEQIELQLDDFDYA
jgi:hypothetical protein